MLVCFSNVPCDRRERPFCVGFQIMIETTVLPICCTARATIIVSPAPSSGVEWTLKSKPYCSVYQPTSVRNDESLLNDRVRVGDVTPRIVVSARAERLLILKGMAMRG